ncbi:unnamed protein product [Alternaria alternata]
MNMMRKKAQYVNITPSATSYIPRQLAIDFLHSHGEIIELNPLVTGHEPINTARRSCRRILFNMMEAAQSNFEASSMTCPSACRHTLMRLQMSNCATSGRFAETSLANHLSRKSWAQVRPPEGLYIREDVEIKCNMTMLKFVKKEMKAAAKVMCHDGERAAEDGQPSRSFSARLQVATTIANAALPDAHVTARQSQQYAQPDQNAPPVPPKQLLGTNDIVMELPGDFYHPQPSPTFLHPNHNRTSTASEPSQYSPQPQDVRWSTASHSTVSSRPSSYAPSEGMRSPGLEQKAFAAELPTMEETKEEHNVRQRRESDHKGQQAYTYNPQDYARTQQQYGSNPPYPVYGQQYPQR